MPTKFRGAELGRGPTQAQTRIPRPPSPRVESYSRQGWSSPARDVTPLGGASGDGGHPADVSPVTRAAPGLDGISAMTAIASLFPQRAAGLTRAGQGRPAGVLFPALGSEPAAQKSWDHYYAVCL